MYQSIDRSTWQQTVGMDVQIVPVRQCLQEQQRRISLFRGHLTDRAALDVEDIHSWQYELYFLH